MVHSDLTSRDRRLRKKGWLTDESIFRTSSVFGWRWLIWIALFVFLFLTDGPSMFDPLSWTFADAALLIGGAILIVYLICSAKSEKIEAKFDALRQEWIDDNLDEEQKRSLFEFTYTRAGRFGISEELSVRLLIETVPVFRKYTMNIEKEIGNPVQGYDFGLPEKDDYEALDQGLLDMAYFISESLEIEAKGDYVFRNLGGGDWNHGHDMWDTYIEATGGKEAYDERNPGENRLDEEDGEWLKNLLRGSKFSGYGDWIDNTDPSEVTEETFQRIPRVQR